MKWNGSGFAAALLLGLGMVPCAAASAAGQADAPQGSSEPQPGEQRYDVVGFATSEGSVSDAITAAHPTLPIGTIIEVTALDNGRNILAQVSARPEPRRDRVVELSRGAARLLGIEARPAAPVRVRRVGATAQDIAALRSGRPAAERLNAPPTLLAALRKRLPANAHPDQAPVVQGATPPAAPKTGAAPPHQTPPEPPARPLPSRPQGRYVVQVAALSDAARARALAERLGGYVQNEGRLHRVRLGPFPTTAAAERARADAARRGYRDARIQTRN